jgi:hypothetical protein
MFEATRSSDFSDWGRFCEVYREPIYWAFRQLDGVSPSDADDLTQSLLLKWMEKDDRPQRPEGGQFRRFLYASVRNHAIDAFRKNRRPAARPVSLDAGTVAEPDAPACGSSPEVSSDVLYSLSTLHLVFEKVRTFYGEKNPESWRIFDELVVARIVPGRTPRSRQELLAEFAGRKDSFLSNQIVTVVRCFERFFQALIPAGLSDQASPIGRFYEWLDLLDDDQRQPFRDLMHLAFHEEPKLAAGAVLERTIDGPQLPWKPGEASRDELELTLRFRLELPFATYVDPAYLPGEAASLRLCDLLDGGSGSKLGRPSLIVLLEGVKTHARLLGNHSEYDCPADLALVLYTTAITLARVRCETRITSLDDAQIAANLRWCLVQSWIDPQILRLARQGLEVLEGVPRTGGRGENSLRD